MECPADWSIIEVLSGESRVSSGSNPLWDFKKPPEILVEDTFKQNFSMAVPCYVLFVVELYKSFRLYRHSMLGWSVEKSWLKPFCGLQLTLSWTFCKTRSLLLKILDLPLNALSFMRKSINLVLFFLLKQYAWIQHL